MLISIKLLKFFLFMYLTFSKNVGGIRGWEVVSKEPAAGCEPGTLTQCPAGRLHLWRNLLESWDLRWECFKCSLEELSSEAVNQQRHYCKHHSSDGKESWQSGAKEYSRVTVTVAVYSSAGGGRGGFPNASVTTLLSRGGFPPEVATTVLQYPGG